MDRRTFINLSMLGLSSSALSACGYLRIDLDSVYLRSELIDTPEKEQAVLAKASLGWTSDGKIRVLQVAGTPYERGYQHGKLLREEVQENLGSLYDGALGTFRSAELFQEVFERLRPFIPQEYIDEMHGLAHGSRLPLSTIHAIHALPEMTEWGGKKKLKGTVKKMMAGELGTTCSNFCAYGGATADGAMYTVRVLDWGLHRISNLHDHPLITISRPEQGIPSANIGWIGFLGAVSGMNAQGITLGEMGYGDPENETLRGKPMPFLLRDVLTHASNLTDVRKIISTSPGTNSFVFLMSDGKSQESELYIRDRERFEIYKPGQGLKDNEKNFPGIEEILYGGHFDDRMTESLTKHRGKLTPDIIMKEVIPYIAMKSNFQNVIYDPVGLKFWVNNAAGPQDRAAEQPFTSFDFGAALRDPPRHL